MDMALSRPVISMRQVEVWLLIAEETEVSLIRRNQALSVLPVPHEPKESRAWLMCSSYCRVYSRSRI